MIGPGPAEAVELFAPARIHLGFLDLHGGLGRKFGSLGLTIEDIGVRLRLELGPKVRTEGPSAERADQFLARACTALGVTMGHRLEIASAIPPHVGLGSGTQLGLAVAAALAKLHGIETSTAALAVAMDRGTRSGVGIGAFDRGGFLVDGGRRAGGGSAPIIARFDVPKDWHILLTFDGARNGLHGAAEQAAFAALPPFDEATASRLCRLLVMRLLPGIAEADFDAASEAIAEIQSHIGRHFQPVQEGLYSSAAVAEVQGWLRERGVFGLGQSSWGPTGFALIRSAEQGQHLLEETRKRFGDKKSLQFRLVACRNRGAEIRLLKRTESRTP
ncbi:MAG TPA: beta-ribofuranosylaminobenzene 5'-phosphate synthase family protein [Alphaproteobacteria bacterium]|nr:beta-ribofuranosylaminobenzene 5'-phosphate synthase family protein [Alphaproteobacteria bacterium]